MIVFPTDIERVARLGWRLHPASRISRAACIKGAADLATADLSQLARWAREFPGCNWRVVMEGSGVWALDVDVPGPDHEADGMVELAQLIALCGELPAGPMTRSGGGGRALFFRHRGEPISGRTGTPAPGLDPRRGRLSVTVPPSVHHRTGCPYRWLRAPWDIPPPPAPAWLLKIVKPPEPAPFRPPDRSSERRDAARRYAAAALAGEAERVAAAMPGQRNDTLNRSAWALSRFLAAGTLTASEIAEVLAYAADLAGLDRREIALTLTSALRTRARR